MGRMVFTIIPRDGKGGTPFGAAATFDSSDTGRYEMYITDYAVDICEGETQTARRAYCENADALLTALAGIPEWELGSGFSLGELQTAMAYNISDIGEFFELCDETGVVYERFPLFVERHDS